MTPGTTPDAEGEGDMGLRAAHFDRQWKQFVRRRDRPARLRVLSDRSRVTIDGPIVAYRDRSASEVRDIYVSRFTGDAWTVPSRVHDDGWMIDGCPVNGPAIGAAGRDVAVAWFTSARKTKATRSSRFPRTPVAPSARLCKSTMAGRSGRVDVEQLPDGSAVVGWIEFGAGRSVFKVRRVDRSGGRSNAVSVTDLGATRNSSYPRLARHGQELVFAWPGAGNHLGVETAVAPAARTRALKRRRLGSGGRQRPTYRVSGERRELELAGAVGIDPDRLFDLRTQR